MSMYNHENSHISKIITTKFFLDPTSHTQLKYFCSQNTISTKNFPYLQNFSILIPTKFCHKLHMPTNLPYSSWFCSTKPIQWIFHDFNAPKIQAKTHQTTSEFQCSQNSSQNSSNNITNYQHCQNFMTQCPQNSSQNSSNNITNYQHCQNSISHQHCPDCTMTKRYNISKMLQTQHYNMINHTMPQITTRSHNNTMTMSQHQIFNSKSQILNSTSKFSHPKFPIPKFRTLSFQTPKFQVQTFNSKFSNSKFSIQIFNSKFQNCKLQTLNFKLQFFKISNSKFQVSSFKISSCKFSNSHGSNFQVSNLKSQISKSPDFELPVFKSPVSKFQIAQISNLKFRA